MPLREAQTITDLASVSLRSTLSLWPGLYPSVKSGPLEMAKSQLITHGSFYSALFSIHGLSPDGSGRALFRELLNHRLR